MPATQGSVTESPTATSPQPIKPHLDDSNNVKHQVKLKSETLDTTKSIPSSDLQVGPKKIVDSETNRSTMTTQDRATEMMHRITNERFKK